MVKIVENLLMETGMLHNTFVLALMGKTQSTNLFSAYWWPLQSTQSLQYVPKTISQTGLLHLTKASTGTSAPCRRQWMNSKTCQQRPGNSLANKKIPGGRPLRYHFFWYRYDTDTIQHWNFDTDTILILIRSNYTDTDTIPILQGAKNPDTDTIPMLHENGMIPCMIPKHMDFGLF